MSNRRRDLSAADQKLWRHVTRNVKPYRASNPSRDEPQSPLVETAKIPTFPRHSPKTNPGNARQSLDPITVGITPNIDRRTSTKLKRGKFPIEGRIDLHGLTLRQAHAEFTTFVKSSFDRQARCILVITGKGRGGERDGKIRRELPHWINDPALRTMVLAFTEASIRDGGSGAFYILLKRKRYDSGG